MNSTQILKVDATDVEVYFPISGVTLSLRCPAKAAAIGPNLVEIARMKMSGRLEEAIRIPQNLYREAVQAGAQAVAEFRDERPYMHALATVQKR